MAPNAIVSLRIRDRSVSPVQAEVWLEVIPAERTSTTEVHGRLVGPRCPYASTVEVAYPLRPLPRQGEASAGILMRVIIPEASLWDPESPFLYEGPVELWEKGQQVDQLQVRHGLRSVYPSPAGLRVNGRTTALQGVTAERTAPDGWPTQLHQQGYNLLLAPASADDLWGAADRFGFLMLGHLETRDQLPSAARLARCTSSVGFVLTEQLLAEPGAWETIRNTLDTERSQLLGVQLSGTSTPALPDALAFVVCREEALARLDAIQRPVIVLTDTGLSEALMARPDVLGWIQG
jgi:hypothetical protein